MQAQLVIRIPEQAGMLRKASWKGRLRRRRRRQCTRDFVTWLGFAPFVSLPLAMLLDTAATAAINTNNFYILVITAQVSNEW